MLRSLLVGVNGSRWSEAACEIGMAWAADLHIPLTCLGVVDVPALIRMQSVSMGAGEVAFDPGLLEAEQARIKAAIQLVSGRAERAGITCRLLTREGPPAVLLGEEAQRHDLLILGRRLDPKTGVGTAPSEMLVDVLRHSPRPIILSGTQVARSSHVVIAYDGSAQASRTLQSFVTSGLFHGHPLHLVGVSNEPEQMSQILGRATDFLTVHCLRPEVHVLPNGSSAAQTLIEFAKSVSAGLMVLGAYGQPWYKQLLFGSLTISALKHCPVPLFLNH